MGFRPSIWPCAAMFGALSLLTGCGTAGVRRFPLRDPMWTDSDTRPYYADCTPDPKKPKHAVCTPLEYVSPFVWDGVDAMVFRPVSRLLQVDPAGESENVNAFDEVPSSSWFENRIGRQVMTPEEAAIGPCEENELDTTAADGSWLIDKGKDNGANPGFRIKTPEGRTFLFKADEKDHPERATGATAIATRIYHAAGYWTGCDAVVYVRRELLKLGTGLQQTDNTGVTRPFETKHLERILAGAARRGDHYRFVASKWLEGKPLGPFRYEGVRKDDPNDVIPHQDRRELRGQRLLAAWLGHFDSREQNSMTTWMARRPDEPDSSPGYIRHWIIDLNDCFGSEWAWDNVTKRINFSYYFDGGDVAWDYVTLGIPERPWDKVRRRPEAEIFGYFDADLFDPEGWKPGYQNAAFLRMSERDGAWMARIIARFSPEHVERIVRVGDFTQPVHASYLAQTLVARQRKILRRYFSKLSPVTDLEVNGSALCGVDLARRTGVFDASAFRYSAVVRTGTELDHRASAFVAPIEAGRLCVPLPHVAEDAGERDDSPRRYMIVEIANGAATDPLRVHLYDLGPRRGHRLVGVER
ncbi:MAG TPA: hypothetical protein VM925_34095 [Labilithrix sp.]|nr:hypothetical protein [Labilithrix sp.]